MAEKYLASDVTWCVAHPVNDLKGREQVVEEFLKPLLLALPDLERKPFIMLCNHDERSAWVESIADDYEDSCWVDGTGYFVGTFKHSIFDIPATHRTLNLRYTEMVRIENQKISECYLIPDFIDVMNQARVNPLRKSLGHSGQVMPPTTQDGLRYVNDSLTESAVSSQLVLDMLDCLGRYDGITKVAWCSG